MASYPTSIGLKKAILRYRGIFDFDGLYNYIVSYLKARRYWVQEDKYKHKVPSPLGAEQEIGFKQDRKLNDFISFTISVAIHLWDMTEVEVEVKGQKKMLTSARMEIILQGTLGIDYEKRWETSNLWIQLRDFYLKYIAKEEVESIYGDTLQYRVQLFLDKIKQFLDMEAKGYEYAGYIGDNR